jgi:hypothetical protein
VPHLKCVPCKARLYSAGSPPDPVGDLCPGCGSLLEPVGELSEVVGFRSITSRDSAGDGSSGTHQRIAERLEDFLASRDAVLAQARLDAERWLDDSGSFRAEAPALARPETNA